MSIQLPAEVIEQLKTAPRLAEVVGPDGQVVGLFTRTDPSRLDRLPPELVSPGASNRHSGRTNCRERSTVRA